MIEFSRDGVHYLAGPYRGAVRHNIRQAERWAAECARRGIFFICPHLNSAFMSEGQYPDAPPAFWLEMDKHILVNCERILLLPGWEYSEGAKAEKALAVERAINMLVAKQIKQGCTNQWQKKD